MFEKSDVISMITKISKFYIWYTIQNVLGVQKSSELFFVKFNLYSYVIVRKWLAA